MYLTAYCCLIFNRKAIISRIHRKRFKNPGKTQYCSCRGRSAIRAPISVIILNNHPSAVPRSIRVPAASCPGAGPVHAAPCPFNGETPQRSPHRSKKRTRISPHPAGERGSPYSPFPRIKGRTSPRSRSGRSQSPTRTAPPGRGFLIGAGYHEVYAYGPGKPGEQVIITPTATYEDTVTIDGTPVPGPGNIQPGHNKKSVREMITGLFRLTVILRNTGTGGLQYE